MEGKCEDASGIALSRYIHVGACVSRVPIAMTNLILSAQKLVKVRVEKTRAIWGLITITMIDINFISSRVYVIATTSWTSKIYICLRPSGISLN